MAIIPMRSLLEAGVHFGHQTRRWDPRMAPYIYTARNGIYILDLQKTLIHTAEAYEVIRLAAEKGDNILFVGTKRQVSDCIKEEAIRAGMYFINSRWLGGTLTNFNTIKQRIARLKKLEKMQEDGTFEVLPKKEVAGLKLEMEKLEKNLGGIKEMKKIPTVIFLVDSKKEFICTREARKLGITTIGLIDSNCNPDDVDIVVPGNDDAIRSVKLITAKMADAVIHGRDGLAPEEFEADTEVQTMAQLVEQVGEDKIERKMKPRMPRPDFRRNNYSNNREGAPYNRESAPYNREATPVVKVAPVIATPTVTTEETK